MECPESLYSWGRAEFIPRRSPEPTLVKEADKGLWYRRLMPTDFRIFAWIFLTVSAHMALMSGDNQD